MEGDGWTWVDSDVELIFLSTPSGWRATQQYECKDRNINISIHALRVEGDGIPYFPLQTSLDISIHALRVEGDQNTTPPRRSRMKFLSTPSGWRATDDWIPAARRGGISIHALRVEGDAAALCGWICASISIHALRVEGDLTHPADVVV